MLFNLNFANSNNTAVFAQISNPITKLVISIGIPIKEEKAEFELHPVTAEAKLRKFSL